MRTEYTARHTTWTEKLRNETDAGLARTERLLGKNCSAHVVLCEEKFRQVAEVTVTCKHHTFTAKEEGFDMAAALQAALHKVETQAQKHTAKTRDSNRQPDAAKAEDPVRRTNRVRPMTEEDIAAGASNAVNNGNRASGDARRPRVVPVVTHSFPSAQPIAEPHIVRSPDVVSTRALTLEEAVKEAAFRDKEVFVYRNPEGRVNVLYRQRDGKMALIEAP